MGNHRTETRMDKSVWPHPMGVHISFFLNSSEPQGAWLFSSGLGLMVHTRLNDTIYTSTDVSKERPCILGNCLDLTQAGLQTYFKVFVCSMKALDSNWRQVTS